MASFGITVDVSRRTRSWWAGGDIGILLIHNVAGNPDSPSGTVRFIATWLTRTRWVLVPTRSDARYYCTAELVIQHSVVVA